VEDKEYPCNETRAGFIAVLKKSNDFDWKEFITQTTEIELWHTLYSISEKTELKSALGKVAKRLKVDYETLEPFVDFPPFKKDYGAFSIKALNKFLPLLRLGKYWDKELFTEKILNRIEKIINAEDDDTIHLLARQKAFDKKLDSMEKFQGLPLWLASYVVYGRHSEIGEKIFWKKPEQIERLKQHSLRNPIVEQVINETLQVIKDIWIHYGNGEEKFFDEIHVELGRDMKNPAEKRKRLTNQNTENQNTNLRIRAILKEMMSDSSIEGDVRDYSPSQQDLLKIYEEGVLTAYEKLPDDIDKISRKAEPTQSEIHKYRLWMEQKYVSPYTGQAISLSKLFTTAYEIEHVLPQSRYFDDSLSNKVICEAEVNSVKDNQTGYEFIEKYGGQIVHCAGGKQVKIKSKEDYESHIQRNFKGRKKDILLMPDIPESFTNRQMNDSRYISKVVMKLMSNFVREESEEEATSKHIVPITGKVTTRLKRDWGLNDVWNDLIAPRFQRMNEMTGTNDFGYWNEKGGNKFFRNDVPHELKKDFDPKRIDHRHHALDALVVALADRRHVNYLNNQSAAASKKEKRFDLRKNLRHLENKQITDKITGELKTIQVAKEFLKPWKNLTKEAKDKLETTVVSVKQNKRVINKNINRFEKWKFAFKNI
jgi:CRISPR-associated endonuclease Csn1